MNSVRLGTGSGVSRRPWIVSTYHLFRTFLFANAFVFSAVHVWDRSPSPGLWILLVVTFLIYPHAVFFRTVRVANPQRAELQNIVIDCFVVAIPMAALGFPLWSTFALFITTTINNAFSSGPGRLPLALGAFVVGSLIGAAATGFQVAPDTSELVTALSIFALTWFLLGVGNVSYDRALKLRVAREELRRRIGEIDALQVQLREQANRDPLSGLFNRRYLQSTMEREMARCLREGTSMSVMLMDLDKFKNINDRHGHVVGDEVIILLSKMLSSESRQEDVPCRYGGEEFMLLLPKMPLSVAQQRADEWRKKFGGMTVQVGPKRIGTTLSIGIAEFPTHSTSAQGLIECADQALYQAKQTGRNKVVSYEANARA